MSFIGRAFRKVVNVLSDIGGAIFGVGASMVPTPIRRAVGRAIQPQGPPLIRGPVQSPIYPYPSPLDNLDPRQPRLPSPPPVDSPRYPNPSPLDRLDPRQPRLPGAREEGYETPEEIPSTSEESGYDTPDEIASDYDTPEEIPDEKEGKEEKGDIPDDLPIEYYADFKEPIFNDPQDRLDIPIDERKNIQVRMDEEILRISALGQAFDIGQYLRNEMSDQERGFIEGQFSRFIAQFQNNRRVQLVHQLLNERKYSALARLISEGYEVDNDLYLGFINAISDAQYVVIGLYYPALGIQYLPMNAMGLEALKSKILGAVVETVYVASDNWEQYLGQVPMAMIVETKYERPPSERNVIPNRAVGFFPKLNVNPLGIDLSCIQIYRITDHPQYGKVSEDKMDGFPNIEHCLIWCLKYYGIEESVIQHIKMAYPLGAHLAKSKLQSIAKIIRRDILVSFFGKNTKIRRNTYLCECQPSGITLSLGIYDDHIFVNHSTVFSKAYIKADGIPGTYDLRGVGLDMIHLVKAMDKKGWFIYSGLVARSSGSTIPAEPVLSDSTIEDEQMVCQKKMKKNPKVKPVIFVADFEADTCYEVSKQLKELIETKIELEEMIALGGSLQYFVIYS